MSVSIQRSWIAVCVLSLSSVPATAQSFNIDVGFVGTPAPSYGGAAGQPGTWVTVNPSVGFNLLPDITGTQTNLSLNFGGTFGFGSFDSPATGGDDDLLMDDYVNVAQGPANSFLYCLGLESGYYDVYVYAWNPETPGATTEIRMEATDIDGVQTVGAPWPGGHSFGSTYSKHTGFIANAVVIVASGNGGLGTVNGIQFVKLGEPVGSEYCVSSPNSTGAPAEIAGAGTASVSANDLLLLAFSVPDQPGLFYYGPAAAQAPFGNGTRCVDGPFARLPAQLAEAGVLRHGIDYGAPPTAGSQITSGSTWFFQAWFRDPAAGGTFFDLSDGLEVTFGP